MAGPFLWARGGRVGTLLEEPVGVCALRGRWRPRRRSGSAERGGSCPFRRAVGAGRARKPHDARACGRLAGPVRANHASLQNRVDRQRFLSASGTAVVFSARCRRRFAWSREIGALPYRRRVPETVADRPNSAKHAAYAALKCHRGGVVSQRERRGASALRRSLSGREPACAQTSGAGHGLASGRGALSAQLALAVG